jgi:nucleoside 2-deoxyribosyltransferase
VKAYISYSLKDAAFAASLRERIEQDGVRVFDPLRDVPPGVNFIVHLREEIEDSDALILVVPEIGASQANTALFEAGAAKALGKPILAVMPDSIGREAPTSIADFAIFDASKKPMEEVVRTLVHALEPA